MPIVNENRVDVVKCPHCGMPRPEDWYAVQGGPCWRCRALRPELARPAATSRRPGDAAPDQAALDLMARMGSRELRAYARSLGVPIGSSWPRKADLAERVAVRLRDMAAGEAPDE